MTNQELDELRDIFYELGKLVQRYGGKYYTIQLNIIMGIIECIDSECCCPHELSLTCSHESSSDCLTFCHQSLQGCRLTTGGNKDYVVMVPSISCSTTYLII